MTTGEKLGKLRGILDKIAALYGKTWAEMGSEDCRDVIRRLRKGSLCSARCEGCFWAGYLSMATIDSGNTACFYVLFPGNGVRPCPAGDGCTVFRAGRVIRRPRPLELRWAETI